MSPSKSSFALRTLDYVLYLGCVIHLTMCIPDIHVQNLTKECDKSPKDEDNFKLMTDMTLGECVRSCEYRERCKSLTYNRLMLLCFLFQQDYDCEEERANCTKSPRGHFFIRKSQWNSWTPPNECDSCNETQTCHPGEQPLCLIEECPPLKLPGDADKMLLGNEYTVGKRLRVKCKPGFIETGKKRTTTCQKNGQWEEFDVSCELDKPHRICFKEGATITVNLTCPGTKVMVIRRAVLPTNITTEDTQNCPDSTNGTSSALSESLSDRGNLVRQCTGRRLCSLVIKPSRLKCQDIYHRCTIDSRKKCDGCFTNDTLLNITDVTEQLLLNGFQQRAEFKFDPTHTFCTNATCPVWRGDIALGFNVNNDTRHPSIRLNLDRKLSIAAVVLRMEIKNNTDSNMWACIRTDSEFCGFNEQNFMMSPLERTYSFDCRLTSPTKLIKFRLHGSNVVPFKRLEVRIYTIGYKG